MKEGAKYPSSVYVLLQEMEHGGETSSMRNLSGLLLLRQLPVLQRLQQRLMDCKPSGKAAHDPVVQAALVAVLKESFKVYKAISEGIINLADRFFEMEYLEAQKGLEIYKESIVGNNRLQVVYLVQAGVRQTCLLVRKLLQHDYIIGVCLRFAESNKSLAGP